MVSLRRPVFREAALQRAFERDGFVLVDLFDADDLAALRELFQTGEGGLADRAFYFSILSADAAYRQRVSAGIKRVLALRLDALLDRCRPVFGQFFVKSAADAASRTDVHQDWSWVDEARHYSLNVWSPLGDTSPDNGCLAMIPGSQQLNPHPRGGTSEALPYSGLWPVLQRRYSVELVLEAGQAVLFDQRLFHWAGPNRSTARRVAATCFVAPREADLRYWYRDPQNPETLQEMAIDDDFFTTFSLTVRPAGYRTVGISPYRLEPLDERRLASALGGALCPTSGLLDYDGYQRLVLAES